MIFLFFSSLLLLFFSSFFSDEETEETDGEVRVGEEEDESGRTIRSVAFISMFSPEHQPTAWSEPKRVLLWLLETTLGRTSRRGRERKTCRSCGAWRTCGTLGLVKVSWKPSRIHLRSFWYPSHQKFETSIPILVHSIRLDTLLSLCLDDAAQPSLSIWFMRDTRNKTSITLFSTRFSIWIYRHTEQKTRRNIGIVSSTRNPNPHYLFSWLAEVPMSDWHPPDRRESSERNAQMMPASWARR